jgi:hypothetical protein
MYSLLFLFEDPPVGHFWVRVVADAPATAAVVSEFSVQILITSRIFSYVTFSSISLRDCLPGVV